MPVQNHTLRRLTALSRLIANLGFFVAGTSVLIQPIYPWSGGYSIVGGFLALGGLLAAMAVIFDNWALLAVGLPLMASAFLAFGVLEVSRDPTWPNMPSYVMLFSFGWIMTSRWLDVMLHARFMVKEVPCET